ncbi:MAG: SH3 domain-containing protein [Synergistaceae bacterium]|nr:SH3 domain-containing protein [Synergistaceae bacterium]
MGKKIFLVLLLPFLILSVLMNDFSLFKSAKFIKERNAKYYGNASSSSSENSSAASTSSTAKSNYIDAYIGICTGNYVRVREEPNTDAKIFGRVHKGDKLALLYETKYGNQHWYEVVNPFGAGTARISAQYVQVSDEVIRLNVK